MPATANFLRAWRVSGRDAQVLVRFDVLAGQNAAFTLYASTGLLTTPNGITWEPLLIDAEPINAPGSFGETSIQLCSCRLKIANKKMGWQSNAAKAFADVAYTMHDRQWVGSNVTIYLWEESLTSFNDALPIFYGQIQTIEPDVDQITIVLKQRTNWNKPFPPLMNPEDFPRANFQSMGQPKPVIYGRMTGPPLQMPPHSAQYSDAQRHIEMVRKPRGLAQCTVADMGGSGTNKPYIMVASHRVVNINDPTLGTAMWVEMNGVLCRMLVLTGNFIDSNTLTAAAVEQYNQVEVPIKLGDVLAASSARNVYYLLDPNGNSYSLLTANTTAGLIMSSMTDVGTLFATPTAFLCYETIGSVGTITFAVYYNSVLSNSTTLSASPGAQTFATLTMSPAPPTWDDFKLVDIRLTLQTSGQLKLYFMGMKATSYMRQTPGFKRGYGKILGLKGPPQSVRGHDRHNSPGRPDYGPGVDPRYAYATSESDFYTSTRGFKDGTPGPYGTPSITGGSGLIEKGGDMFAHMLHAYGGDQAGGAVEASPGTFGSYIDANADLKTWNNQDMIFAGSFYEGTDVSSLVSWLADSSNSWAYINRFTDRWHLVPWNLAEAANYSITFGPREIVEAIPEVRFTPFTDIATGIRCGYGYDAQQRGYRDLVEVGPSISNAGFEYSNTRDEDTLNRPGIFDTIEFQYNNLPASSPYYKSAMTEVNAVDNLTLAGNAQAAMRATLNTALGTTGTPARIHVGYHGRIFLNYNNSLQWMVTGGPFSANIAPAFYSMEGLATAAQTALNSTGPGGFTVTYSRTTRKFTITRGVAFDLHLLTQAPAARLHSAWPALGFRMDADRTGLTTATSDFPCEEQRYYFTAEAAFALRWASGSEGSDLWPAANRQCAALYGFDPRLDGLGATTYTSDGPKGAREMQAAAATTLYGSRRQINRDLRLVQDNATAREVRNRLFDMYYRPRVQITFTTNHAPDIERGRVISFSSDFDNVMAYPEKDTDGSWAGKRFAVTEVEQHLGPTAFYTRITAVSLGT